LSNLVKAFPDFFTVDENTGVKTPAKFNSGQLVELFERQYGDRIKFNLLKLELEIDGRQVSDLEESLLYMQLAKKGITSGNDTAKDALWAAGLLNQYNPVQDYLEKVEKDSLVYPTNIDSISSDFLKTTEPLFDQMMKVFLIGCVKRAFERGSKHDTMLVIKGHQGLMKSTFFKSLVPNETWFTDTAQTQQKQRLMQLQTNWIVECAEVETLTTKAEAGELKALLSSASDNFLPPYGRKMIRADRPSVMVGTCNKDSFLNDTTGSRRFHIIRLLNKPEDKIDFKLVATERDSIWKAAINAYRSGEPNWLNVEAERLSEEYNADYQIENPYYSKLAEWINSAPDLFTLRMALNYSGIIGDSQVPKKYYQQLAGEALRELGFDKVQKRINGVRERYWYKIGGKADPNVPKSEGEKVTPKALAVSSKEDELSPVPNSLEKEGDTQKQPHKAIRWESGEDLVTQTREDGKTVIGYSFPSPLNTEEELDKWEKERNKHWDEVNKFWAD